MLLLLLVLEQDSFICMCAYIFIHLVFTCVGAGVQRPTHVRGQLAGVGFLLPPRGSFEPRSPALAADTFILWATLSAPIFDYFLVQNYWLFQGKVLRQFVSMRQEGSLVSLMRNFN